MAHRTWTYKTEDGSLGVGVELKYDSPMSGHDVSLYWEHGKLVGGDAVEYGEWRDLDADECWERWGEQIGEFEWEVRMFFEEEACE